MTEHDKDRNHLIDVLDRQAEHVRKHGKPRMNYAREGLALMKSIRDALESRQDDDAVDAAEKLKSHIEAGGGIVKGAQRIGPHGSQEVVIYASKAVQTNHTYVCDLVAAIREVAEAAPDRPAEAT